ncbi:MAG: DUF2164 family protein [Patescibacteria group bacterium]
MKQGRSRLSLLTEEEKQKGIGAIISFFESERNEKIGIIAAGEILELLEDTVGLHIYNKGIEDARSVLKQQLEESDYRLVELKRD